MLYKVTDSEAVRIIFFIVHRLLYKIVKKVYDECMLLRLVLF